MLQFYTSERSEWRRFLSEHFETETEIGFVFPMKGSGEPSLSYNDAVEEALCFGWIDSTIRHVDPLHRVQRFTPRRKGSPYSRPNIERLIWLDARGLIHPKVRETVLPLIETPYEFPPDIIDAIRQDECAWAHYETFSDSYKRIRIAYIDDARKRPEEFEKRLKNFLDKTRQGKMIRGYGGIEKYYRKMLIETKRLYLRELMPEDLPALSAVLCDREIMQYYPYTFDENRVREWINRNINRYKEHGFGLWAVCLKDSGELIGDCGLTLQNINGGLLPEIGYHIRRDCQHKGYAKEAASAVRDWAFAHTDYPALYSYCKYTNIPSIRTAEAIGMHAYMDYPDEANGITHVSMIEKDKEASNGKN